MKTYINTITLEYPVFENMIKHRYKGVSWPVVFNPPSEYAEVAPGNVPLYNPTTSFIDELDPMYIDGKWVKQWVVKEYSSAQRHARRAAEFLETKKNLIAKVQQRLDNFVRAYGYDDIMTVCSYATSKNPVYVAEGQWCVDLRDSTWEKTFEILEDVQLGKRPTNIRYEDIESELPKLLWPTAL